MLTKTITYTDYNGVTRTEKFYFNLTKAEVAELELTHPGGYAAHIQRIIDAKDQAEVVKEFKFLILKSYGEKTDDGKHFRKSEKLSEEFSETEAYSELFVELLTNVDASIAFVNGIMPIASLNAAQKAELDAKTKELIESNTVVD